MDLVDSPTVTVVPADPAGWDDIQTVFGSRGQAHRCQCTRIRLGDHDWFASVPDERELLLREQLAGDETGDSGGMVAYVGEDPAGWLALAPRPLFRRYQGSSVPWAGRDEVRDDETVWAAVCFVVRREYRGRGLTYPLARAAVEHARAAGAHAIEGYPMIVQPGRTVIWDELNVGAVGAFSAAGFREVAHPTKRRLVMRIDFDRTQRRS